MPRKRIKTIYLIGALKNNKVIQLENELRKKGFEPFAEWINPGPKADEYWRKYEKQRGRSYREALKSYHGQHTFSFDKKHLDRCDAGVVVWPVGKSGHTELGFLSGRNKPVFIYFDKEPKRYDLMHNFATDVCMNKKELFQALREYEEEKT